jgi:hypothetical protein
MSKSNKGINDDDTEFLIDLLLETSMPVSQIANELQLSIAEVNAKINQLGLSWLKQSRKKMSRGQTALTAAMQKLLPGEEIINEFHIGDKMKLDVYCPSYALAAEYHGRQHFYYTSRFFSSRYEFEEAQKRDIKKAEWCKENGIALIVFRYNDSLNEVSVYNRMLEAIRSTEMPTKSSSKKSITSSKYYQEIKKKNSQYKKDLYKKIKGKKN